MDLKRPHYSPSLSVSDENVVELSENLKTAKIQAITDQAV
jgi:hypothetical protein